MDSLHKELEPILTDEQNERLKRELERMKKWRDRGPGPMPPSPGLFDSEPQRPPEMDFK